MNLDFAIIAAVDADFGIGKNGTLPWQLPADLKHFKTITASSAANKKNLVIMGRRTWESLPDRFKPLPERINLVLSRQAAFKLAPGVILSPDNLASTLDHLTQEPIAKSIDRIFIIGGAEIFRQAISHPACRKLYLTHIAKSFACDCFFPQESLPLFRQSKKGELASENLLPYFFAEYERV